eukprot:CAMPEP_0197434764 /NCGR_PEP_ID=MMETSP1175-20131217/2451_1 /TAXON_ID=1003142 /ORGANISM="Triceratium dubium, Strain CCMP147" /LENGTH=187 /DNA_ID=CAMNT_0042963601 /DNA_START=195 /DNA_END=754 /DNA_ORIENTATION=+
MKFSTCVLAIIPLLLSGAISQDATGAFAAAKEATEDGRFAAERSRHRSLRVKSTKPSKGSKGSKRPDPKKCDPVGVYDVQFYCEDGAEVIAGAPYMQFHEIFDRGDGFYNFWAQLPSPPLQFNFTMLPVPGEINKYEGGVTWLNYYPGPLTSSDPIYPPPEVPVVIPMKLEFDEDCNYWTDWMTQRP